ncbi:antirestriction protein [Escherichia coli]|nr:antirestriction protein [Escherichia coli]ELP4036546.1 antirestriction protein [Escherichia coli]
MQYAKPVTLNVEECDRLSFLPYLFGNDFLYAEAYVYALAQKMMPNIREASGTSSACRTVVVT